jgi:hypothetical protein
MDSTNGNVEMHFGKISIEVNSVGHDLFQLVSNGIKAGDQRLSGKLIREATSFLANVRFDLEKKKETFQEGNVNITYYAKAMGKCSSQTILWECYIGELEARLQSLAANAPQQMPDQAAPATYDDIRETAPIHQPRKHNASAVATV